MANQNQPVSKFYPILTNPQQQISHQFDKWLCHLRQLRLDKTSNYPSFRNSRKYWHWV